MLVSDVSKQATQLRFDMGGHPNEEEKCMLVPPENMVVQCQLLTLEPVLLERLLATLPIPIALHSDVKGWQSLVRCVIDAGMHLTHQLMVGARGQALKALGLC
jgi:hypothetical protein